MKFTCIAIEHQLSPKKEDCVFKNTFKAADAPLGKDRDIFIENLVYWDARNIFEVGKTYDLGDANDLRRGLR